MGVGTPYISRKKYYEMRVEFLSGFFYFLFVFFVFVFLLLFFFFFDELQNVIYFILENE